MTQSAGTTSPTPISIISPGIRSEALIINVSFPTIFLSSKINMYLYYAELIYLSFLNL